MIVVHLYNHNIKNDATKSGFFYGRSDKMFLKLEDFFTWLSSQNKFSIKLHLTRIKRACEILGNPQNKVKSLHVAGTNGKGSTCNYLSYMLQASGYKVGLYISPFIEVFNERIQINNVYISDEELLSLANEIYPVISQVETEMNDEMTEFEIITLLSFVYFEKNKVDYVVYEVGMGGRYDATNVIDPLVMGITNISWDHMNILGNTLEKIGFEKVGIAKPNKMLYTTEENPSVLEVFKNYCYEVNCHFEIADFSEITKFKFLDNGMKFVYKPLNLELMIPMLGEHQLKNVLLAIKMYLYLLNQEHVNINKDNIANGLKKAKWNGRLDIVSKKPFVIIDGSHNIEGVRTLTEAMKIYLNKGYKINIIFSALKDKETDKMLNLLQSISSKLTLTSFEFYRANTAMNLYEQTNKQNVYYNEDFKDTINNELKLLKDQDLLLITGSLYFISQVKKYLKEIDLYD
ncbi:MAG: bifunctional protein FolC [Haloplasmataceae bacterium]|jgi:dihydrofolate synthase/folylpolyglutamate synthase|nr:bifunctional protein FolC [Haloplasmataceae bacterium]